MSLLSLQLETRYRRLKKIRKSLWGLRGEDLTHEKADPLKIDLHHLDIKTGATSDSVIPFFLPRTSFPSCRDMRGDIKDRILDKRNMESDIAINAALQLNYLYYIEEMNKQIGTVRARKVAAYGWVKDESNEYWNNPPRPKGHFLIQQARYKFASDTSVYENDIKIYDDKVFGNTKFYKQPYWLSYVIPSFQTLSHGMTEYEVSNCHQGLPSISEVLAAVDEILHSMKAQRVELRNKDNQQAPARFNHILPRLVLLWDLHARCRLLYAYFDGSRLKVQFTEVLDFKKVLVPPPPEVTYRDHINLCQYYDMMDKLLKWAWPVAQGDTSGLEI